MRHAHSGKKTKAFWIPLKLDISCESIANSIFEILAPEPAQYDENRPSYDSLNMTQINFLCAEKTSARLKEWKIAKVVLYQNGNGTFVPKCNCSCTMHSMLGLKLPTSVKKFNYRVKVKFGACKLRFVQHA